MRRRQTVLDDGFEVEVKVRLAQGDIHRAVRQVTADEMAAFLTGAPESGAALALDVTADAAFQQVRNEIDPQLPPTTTL